MIRSISLGCALWLLAGVALAADAPPAIDINQPQSPPKPLPPGLKLVDQGTFNPALKGYFMPEGFRLDIVATDPAIINPVGMRFDTDGTLYVLEWRPHNGAGFPEFKETFKYQDGSTKLIATMKKTTTDIVKILRYNAEKGIYDKAELILEDELPSTILVHDGWIYLTGRGTVRRYKQSKPGGPYDVKEVIAQGFCGFHHHQVSGLTIGNDGWLYITSGDDDNFVEGSDGKRATVLRTGAVFRCHPDGSHMQIYSIGWRNPYRDLAFDTAMNWFHVDNDNEDGSKFTGCRLMHVVEGADYGWRLFPGARCCRPDMIRGAVYGELPGKLPPMLKTGRGSPAGLLIYNDTQLPEFYRGLLYYPDVFRKVIRAYEVQPKGSTFQVTQEFEFLKSDDPLFRPCQMITGPDGAIYICDWRTDSGGAGKLWGDNVNGRIYRARWVGGKTPGAEEETPTIELRGMDSWAKIVKGSDAELLASLEAPAISDRLVAQGELRKRGDKNRAALMELVQNAKKPVAARIAALGVLNSFWNADVQKLFIDMLRDGQADLRRLAADGLGLNCQAGDKDATTALTRMLNDNDDSVKRAMALALGTINDPGAAGSLVAIYRGDDGQDVYLTDGLIRAIERTGDAGMQELLALARSGDGENLNKAVKAFLAMRTMPAVKALPELLGVAHLKDEQRAELIRSFNNYLFDPPLPPDALLDYLTSAGMKSPLTLKTGLEVLASGGNLKGAKVVNFLTNLLDGDEPALRLTAIQAIEANRLEAAAPRLVQVLEITDRPLPERLALVKALRVLGNKEAIPALEAMLVMSEKPEPADLRSEALQTLSSLDPTKAFAAAEKLLDQPDAALQTQAVLILGNQPAGAKVVGERFLAQKLPRSLLPQVSDALRKHNRNPEVAKLLGQVMKGGFTVGDDAQEIQRVRQIVMTKGDAIRGRSIYLNSKALACVTCHKLEGSGGAVGPDLTRVWDTFTVEKLIETIINPSKEIKEGYQTYVVETKKEQIFSGLKVIDTPKEVVIREASGKDIRIPRDEIVEISLSKVSLMPDNVISELNFEQFVDLVAFLKSRDAQESLRGMALEFNVVGPFGNDITTAYPPEANPDVTASYPGAEEGKMVKWQMVGTGANGLLDLSALYGKQKFGSYVLTYVYSPKPQKTMMLVGCDDLCRVWINGKLAHEHLVPRSALPDQDKVNVDLQQGWNLVLVKVINREAESGLYLRFQGGEGVRVSAKKE